jgi:hypothetical protein
MDEVFRIKKTLATEAQRPQRENRNNFSQWGILCLKLWIEYLLLTAELQPLAYLVWGCGKLRGRPQLAPRNGQAAEGLQQVQQILNWGG